MLEHYFKTGKYLCDFDEIVEEAKVLREKAYQKKVQWRLDHPKPPKYGVGKHGELKVKNKRKGLQKPNLGNYIAKAIRERFKDVNTTNS